MIEKYTYKCGGAYFHTGDTLYEKVILGVKRLFDPHMIFNSDKKESVRVEDWINMLKW